MRLVHGRNLVVSLDGTVIACARSCDVSIDADTTEVSSPNTGTWKRYIVNRMSWSVSVSTLVAVAENLQQFLSMVGKQFTLRFYMKDMPEFMEYQGEAICTGSKLTATIGNLTSASVTFQGSDELVNPMATEINIKGLLNPDVGGADEGYFLMYSTLTVGTSTTKVLNRLLYQYFVNEMLYQEFLTPSTSVKYIYTNSSGASTIYKWNGTKFIPGT